MKVLYIVCGLLVSGLSSCIKQPSLTKQEVMAVIEKFDNAWLKKDLKSVDAVLAPSYVYFTQSGGTFSRRSLVQTAGSPEYTLDTMERSSVMVQLYGNSAVISTRWRGKGIYKGASFNEDQRCSITIIKIKNKVEILSEHCTPIKVARILH